MELENRETEYPLVSIITPSLNQGKTIEKTIKSVLLQEYPNIEHIVMDGGSTDGTLEILRRYEGSLTWESGSDKGQSDAINKGFKKAKGEIVAWLNSDDYYLPGALEKAVKRFSNDPETGLVYGGGYDVDEEGNKLWESRVDPCFDLWKLIHLYDYILQPSTFFRRELLEKVGLISTDYHYIMDWELWVRLGSVARVSFVDAPLSCNRVYAENKTMRGGVARWKEIWTMSKRFGHLRFPPAVITQSPVPLKYTKGRGALSSIVPLVKRLFVLLGLKVSSGMYSDGYVAREGFLSLPLRPESSLLVLTVTSAVKGGTGRKVSVFINNRKIRESIPGDEEERWEVKLAGNTTETSLIHVRFLSAGEYSIPVSKQDPRLRKVSFRLIKTELL